MCNALLSVHHSERAIPRRAKRGWLDATGGELLARGDSPFRSPFTSAMGPFKGR
jgi:hypothetical protein